MVELVLSNTAILVLNAFQTKMWHSNLGKFRRVLVFNAEKVCVSEGFG